MTAPVDVLAVMDDAAVTLQKTAQIQFMERAEEMREARAAVAELIEKSEAALHYMRLHKYADQAWADDLEAALARVQGVRRHARTRGKARSAGRGAAPTPNALRVERTGGGEGGSALASESSSACPPADAFAFAPTRPGVR